VSAIVIPETTPTPTRRPGEIGVVRDAAALRVLTAPLCAAAFEGYVGRPLEGSRYLTFPVVPDLETGDWVTGGRRTICLVARIDGQWMDHPARASGE
jgi:hypothetical protein